MLIDVDTILLYYNLNPAVYQSLDDKWLTVEVHLLLSFYVVLPYLLALAPWVVYVFLRKQYKDKKHKQFLKKIVIASACGVLLGLWLPMVIDMIIAGLAVRGMYGNSF